MADEGFFDLLSRFQSNRMDDQRCCFQEKNRLSAASVATSSTPPKTMIKCNFSKVKSVFALSFCQILFSKCICMQDSVQQWIHSYANLNLFCVSWQPFPRPWCPRTRTSSWSCWRARRAAGSMTSAPASASCPACACASAASLCWATSWPAATGSWMTTSSIYSSNAR